MTQFSLSHSLSLIDEFFSIDRIIADTDAEFVRDYYRQSFLGYLKFYNPWQCMHVPLQDGSLKEEEAFFAQAAEVGRHLTSEPGQRVLELGCGLGANSLHLSQRFPHVEFIGTDLMDRHVSHANTRARGRDNMTFRQASFEALPDDLGQFDVIFAIETLCYARDLPNVAKSIARLLRPGGRIILFDAHRKVDFDQFPADLITAAKLYEITTAVTRGFHEDGKWQQAFEGAGLNVTADDDITQDTVEGLAKIHRRATKAFTDLKWRIALRTMPRYFARNTVAGLLGYNVCLGDKSEPDPSSAPVKYQKICAQKPAA